jgi:amidase
VEAGVLAVCAWDKPEDKLRAQSSQAAFGGNVNRIVFEPVAELAGALARREISSRELLEAYLENIEAVNPAVNAVVTLDADAAFAAAGAADAVRASGAEVGSLHGVPMTIKDSIETAGMRTTSGSPDLAEHVPARDADAVERLRAAGAIIFGKTNLPTLAMDWQSHNPIFGVTNNPWDKTRAAGGSSGGSAAAVAAGLTGLELGSDIRGSLRVPAHFCGVFALKPTFGIVPGCPLGR